MTNLQVEYNKLLETKRYNEAQMQELIRSHQANEAITTWRNQQDVAIAQGNLAVNQAKAQIDANKAVEAARHNVASEQLSAWTNAIAQQNASINQQNANTNRQNANTQATKVNNDFLVQKEKNVLEWRAQDQQARQKAADLNQKRAADNEQARHNLANEKETKRSNTANEAIRGFKKGINVLSSLSHGTEFPAWIVN